MNIKNTLCDFTDVKEIHVKSASLENVRHCMSIAGFEFLEQREFEDGRCDETWISTTTKNSVRINITASVEDCHQEEDTTTEQLVSEVIDLWFELRAIRNLLSEDFDNMLVQKEETPMQRFFESVQSFREERKSSPDKWDFIFSENFDETICAYEELSESDRLAITH